MAKVGIKVYFLATFMVWWTKCDTVVAKAEIKCYCTTIQCQENGNSNMCTSTLGKCFSQIALNNNVKDIHGCTEQLDSNMRTSCLQNGDGDIISTKKDSAYALMCCKGDMCNYLDSKDRPMSVEISSGITNNGNATASEDSSHKGSSRRRHPNNSNKNQSEDMFYSSKEIWFKAAVIAVPIAGGFILIMLVILAIRMLRHDNRRHREYKHNQSLAKAQLYVADHFYNPNNKLLCTEDEYKTAIPQQECVYTATNEQQLNQQILSPSPRDSSNSMNNTSVLKNSIDNNSNRSNNSNSSHHHHHHRHHHHHHSNNVNTKQQQSDSSNTQQQKYSYEKLRESAGFENPCDSVIVWTGQEHAQPQIKGNPGEHV